jgi:hypothetical protein
MQGRYTGMAYPKRLFYLFATTIVTLVGSLLVLFWIGVLTINELRVVQHDEGVINLLRLTQAKLTDAEPWDRSANCAVISKRLVSPRNWVPPRNRSSTS